MLAIAGSALGSRTPLGDISDGGQLLVEQANEIEAKLSDAPGDTSQGEGR
jgi:hypothetical protein